MRSMYITDFTTAPCYENASGRFTKVTVKTVKHLETYEMPDGYRSTRYAIVAVDTHGFEHRQITCGRILFGDQSKPLPRVIFPKRFSVEAMLMGFQVGTRVYD